MGGDSVLFCPRCRKPVEAKDYMDRFYLGFDSVLPRIRCACGYSGLPVSLSCEDYRKLLRDSK
jgi:hypothetical protein